MWNFFVLVFRTYCLLAGFLVGLGFGVSVFIGEAEGVFVSDSNKRDKSIVGVAVMDRTEELLREGLV